MEEKYDVFISYSSQDQKVTEGICGFLEARGIRCFVAYRDIPRGVVWAGYIADAIDVSRMMVVVFSEHFNKSSQTDREIELAAEKPMPILTYRISDNQFTGAKKYYLKNLNWIDAFPDADRHFGLLCENICQLLGIKPKAAPVASPQSPVKEQSQAPTLQQVKVAEVHIETDAECELYRFGERLAMLHTGADNVVHLNPGTYKLTFRSTKYSSIEETRKYTLAPGIFTDYIEVQLKKQVEAEQERVAKEEERKLQEELEQLQLYPYRDDSGKYGFIDKTGKMVIPCQWIFARSFSEGLARVKDDNEKYGFIDKTGKVVIPCQWEEAYDFREGLALVKDDHGKYGFIDKTGKMGIPCQWKAAGNFSEGLAYVKDDHWECGFIDKTGKVVIPCQWNGAKQGFSEGLVGVFNSEYGFIDKTGKVVIPYQWRVASIFSEGLACVKDYNEKYGFIDKTGKVVIPCQWNSADSFSEGLACVKDDHWESGFIDKTGKLVIPCQWEEAYDFREGLALVRDDHWEYGFIDKTGKVVIPCQWKAAGSFSEGLAPVKDDNGKAFYIDKTGKVVK